MMRGNYTPMVSKKHDAIRVSNRQHKLIEQGLCYLCAKPRGESKSKWMCQDCLDRTNVYKQKRREEKLSKGICTNNGCNNLAPNGFHTCMECRLFARAKRGL